MPRIRSAAVILPCLISIALSACHSREQHELQSFAGDVDKAASSLGEVGNSGTLTLHVDAWEAGIAVLPPHGSAKSFNLSEGLTHELEQAADAAQTAQVFLIRDNAVVAQQPLNSTLSVSPGYSTSRDIYFQLARPKTPGQPIEMKMM